MIFSLYPMLRNRQRIHSLLPAAALLLLSCSNDMPSTATVEGPLSFTLLTYNIHGLPDEVTNFETERNMGIISPLLNEYDLVLLQEDFTYHAVVIGKSNHQHQLGPTLGNGLVLGSGLTLLSRFPLGEIEHFEWTTCSDGEAWDCGARKGFTVAEVAFTDKLRVDLYNLHMDAGGSPEDQQARQEQVAQLRKVIRTRSKGKAVIVAGDLNLDIARRADDLLLYSALLDSVDLSDACALNDCGQDLVDRVLFRESNSTALRAVSWQTATKFHDNAGKPLSDHLAVAIEFRQPGLQK